MQIRTANRSDLEAITTLYNEAIETTTATFDTEPRTESEQARWFQEHTERSGKWARNLASSWTCICTN